MTPKPHGNSKRSSGYMRMMPSTLKKLKGISQNLTPKFAVAEAAASVGDLTQAPSADSLPRNRQQIADFRRRSEPTGIEHRSVRVKDPLYSVMLMCKESEGSRASNCFVRIVSGAPEPMAVLAIEWTLKDLERFCTCDHFTILSFDPTFNLGDFNVTVATYRHPMLLNRSGKHPVMT